MNLELRSLKREELRDFLESCEIAFGETVSDEQVASFEQVAEPDRLLAFFDDGRIVATAGAYSFSLTIPGGTVPAAGVTTVAVLPTHRRQGLLTEMMKTQLRDVRDRREPVAVLWASEDAIYQRFGYGPATLQASFNIDRTRTALRDDSPPQGRLRFVSKEEAARVFPAVYDPVCRRTPGMYARSESWWVNHTLRELPEDGKDAKPYFRVLLEVEGRPAAYAVYEVEQSWEQGATAGFLRAKEVVATTPRATREIWRFVFGVDLIKTITSDGFFLPPDHPLLLMLLEPRHLRFTLLHGLWLRVVDVPAALEARSYAADGAVALGISDGMFEENSGIWQLEARGGEAAVRREAGEPELAMGIEELGAVYLGGFSFAQLARAGRIQELRNDAVDRADALFRTDRAPWCAEIF